MKTPRDVKTHAMSCFGINVSKCTTLNDLHSKKVLNIFTGTLGLMQVSRIDACHPGCSVLIKLLHKYEVNSHKNHPVWEFRNHHR